MHVICNIQIVTQYSLHAVTKVSEESAACVYSV
jgi:hypothetical protein